MNDTSGHGSHSPLTTAFSCGHDLKGKKGKGNIFSDFSHAMAQWSATILSAEGPVQQQRRFTIQEVYRSYTLEVSQFGRCGSRAMIRVYMSCCRLEYLEHSPEAAGAQKRYPKVSPFSSEPFLKQRL